MFLLLLEKSRIIVTECLRILIRVSKYNKLSDKNEHNKVQHLLLKMVPDSFMMSKTKS